MLALLTDTGPFKISTVSGNATNLILLTMFTFKPTLFFVSALAMLAAAAPVESETRELSARGPYDIHNGWVSRLTVTIPFDFN